MYVKNYDPERDEIRISCGVCKTESVHKVDQEITYLEEFKQYTNPNFVCPKCQSVTSVNINIPEVEEMELESIALDMPQAEIDARASVRNMMWKKRPDLKKKNRGSEQRKYVNKNASEIAKSKRNIEDAKRNRGRAF